MLKHPTLDLLGQLGLAGMAGAFADLASNDEAQGLGHAEWLALLRDHEATYRNDRAWRFVFVTPGCATTPCPRTSITALRAVSIAACSTCC